MRWLLPAIILLLVVFSGRTQPGKTENPAEKRLKEVISIINNYDPSEASNYIRENYAPEFLRMSTLEEHRAFIARVNDETKNLSVSTVEAPNSGEARAVVRLRLTGAWRLLTIRTEAASPNRITLIRLQLADGPPKEALKKKPATDAAAAKELDEYLKTLEKENIFSGNVLVAKNGKVVFHKAYGMASKEYRYPNTLSTKFIIGSVNKMFTATGILQLVEQNKLSLDDVVSRLLPGVLTDSIAQRIKIRHLLTHTSGLGDFLFTAEMFSKSRANFRMIADYLPLLKDDTLLFGPGARWSYSNTGYLLLGMIIEKVSGLAYEEYIERNIYRPAGMTSTFFPELDRINEGLADTYDKDYLTGKPVFYNTRYVQVIKGTPAGGGFSTCTDLFNFMQALEAGKLLKPGSVQMMHSPKPEMSSPNYGFGMQIFDEGSYGHTGGGPGTNASVRKDEEKGLTVIILCNQNIGGSAVGGRVLEIF